MEKWKMFDFWLKLGPAELKNVEWGCCGDSNLWERENGIFTTTHPCNSFNGSYITRIKLWLLIDLHSAIVILNKTYI